MAIRKLPTSQSGLGQNKVYPYEVTVLKSVNTGEAKTQLSQLLNEVVHGEEITITESGPAYCAFGPDKDLSTHPDTGVFTRADSYFQ